MAEDPEYEKYREDAAALFAVGRSLMSQVGRISVRIPIELANVAVAAWERDDEGEVGDETIEQYQIRDKAGWLALIGLAVSERGVTQGDEVVVDLVIGEIAAALLSASEGPHTPEP
jgi:hypothetical protein